MKNLEDLVPVFKERFNITDLLLDKLPAEDKMWITYTDYFKVIYRVNIGLLLKK